MEKGKVKKTARHIRSATSAGRTGMPSDESPSTPGRAAWVGWRRREPPEKACVKGPGRVTFDSRTAEFDTLLGSKPAFEILAEGSAETLGAHEGASYVANHIIFTTKPFEAPTAGATYQGEIKAVNIPTREVTTLWRCPNLANGATTGPDGRLYVCLQGQQATGTLPGVEFLAGIFSIDPCDESGRVRRFPDSAWCARLLGGGSLFGSSRHRLQGAQNIPPPTWLLHMHYAPPARRASAQSAPAAQPVCARHV